MNYSGERDLIQAFYALSEMMPAMPFEMTYLNIAAATFTCLLTVAIFGSLFIFIWEKCIYDNRSSAAIRTRESRMMDQLIAVSSQIQKLKMPASHGFNHARIVFLHAVCALDKYVDRPGVYRIRMNDRFVVLLAALLHDVDDRKYFPNHRNFENARKILKYAHVDSMDCDAVIRMIKYVSTKENCNSIPDEAKLSPWVLIPRHCDRLEAIGYIGIVRCWEYTLETKNKLFVASTCRANNATELWKIATPARFKQYSATGRSQSMIDHFYDKLLHLHKFSANNEYLDREKMERHKTLVKVCLQFGRSGHINRGILKFARTQSLAEIGLINLQVNSITPMSTIMRSAIDIIRNM